MEEIFCQALFLSAKPLGSTFFTLLVLRFVKMVFLRTATHIMLFKKVKSAVLRRSAYLRGLVGDGDDKDTKIEKAIKALESTVALFCENELSSFAAILAGVIVVGGVQLEYARLSAMNTAAGGWIGTVGGDAGAAQEPPSIPFGCDHAFFFLDAQGPTDIPLLIGNVVLMMLASVRRIHVDQGGRTLQVVVDPRMVVCIAYVSILSLHVSHTFLRLSSPSFVSVLRLHLSSPSLSSSSSPSPLFSSSPGCLCFQVLGLFVTYVVWEWRFEVQKTKVIVSLSQVLKGTNTATMEEMQKVRREEKNRRKKTDRIVGYYCYITVRAHPCVVCNAVSVCVHLYV